MNQFTQVVGIFIDLFKIYIIFSFIYNHKI